MPELKVERIFRERNQPAVETNADSIFHRRFTPKVRKTGPQKCAEHRTKRIVGAYGYVQGSPGTKDKQFPAARPLTAPRATYFIRPYVERD